MPDYFIGQFASSLIQRLVAVIVILFAALSCDLQPGNSRHLNNSASLDIVNIGRLICGGHLPLAIVEKKYQEKLQTFQLNTVQNHDWNDVVTDMESGKLAGTFILSPLAMNLIRNGFAGKIVLMGDRNGNGFVLSNKFKSISDLNNSKNIIAVPHIYSQHNVLLHRVLQRHGVDKEKVTVLGMPPRDMINSLRRGEIDGFIVGEPESNKSIELGVGWMAAISPQIWKNHMDHVLLVTDQFIHEHSDQLQELVSQLLRAGAFIESHPQEAAVMGEDYTGSPAAVFEKVLTDPPEWIDYSDMRPKLFDIKAMSTSLVEMGLWPDMPNTPEVFLDRRFIDNALRQSQGT